MTKWDEAIKLANHVLAIPQPHASGLHRRQAVKLARAIIACEPLARAALAQHVASKADSKNEPMTEMYMTVAWVRATDTVESAARAFEQEMR